MPDSPEYKPRYRIYQNFRLPMGFPVESFESALHYPAQQDDIFVVTYPKCGTTWTQHILWTLQHNGEPLPLGQDINRAIPHLEEVGAEFVQQLALPRFIKTHFPYQLTPHHSRAKYIYIVRNPFDCVVSFYYHTQGFVKHYDFAEGTFDQFFECFMAGEVDGGDYFDHLLSWYPHRNKPNILCLTYEQMKANPEWAVIKIARFLGPVYLEKVQDPQILERILMHTSFARMSQNQSRWSSQRPANMAPFIRKGEVGDWKNHFSAKQIQRLGEKFYATTAGTEIPAEWQNILP